MACLLEQAKAIGKYYMALNWRIQRKRVTQHGNRAIIERQTKQRPSE